MLNIWICPFLTKYPTLLVVVSHTTLTTLSTAWVLLGNFGNEIAIAAMTVSKSMSKVGGGSVQGFTSKSIKVQIVLAN